MVIIKAIKTCVIYFHISHVLTKTINQNQCSCTLSPNWCPMQSKHIDKLSMFNITIALLWLFSCILVGASFYAMSITVSVPNFEVNDPTDNIAITLTTALAGFENVFNFIMPLMSTILGILTIGLLISTVTIGVLLYLWGKDRKKMAAWKEIGFACDRLEFLQSNRIRLNHTELLLNKSQYCTLQKLVRSRMQGKALHGIDLGENATQIVKRLREELGSKLLEKTLIMNHRGKGYWIDIDPKRVKGIEVISDAST